MPTFREWVIEIVVMIAIGAALAALGPFGSFAIGGFGERLLYWIPAGLLGYFIFRPTTMAATLAARRLDLPQLHAAVLATLVAAIPGTVAIAWLGGGLSRRMPTFNSLFDLYVNVAIIGTMVMVIFSTIARLAPEPPANEVPAVPPSAVPSPQVTTIAPPRAPFLDRLPRAWADRLLALEMEDHYVRAHGPEASALILLRMRDAEAELAGTDGLRIHRSWWVARAALDRPVRDGRGYRLRLTNGLEAPVARDRVATLKAAGWLA